MLRFWNRLIDILDSRLIKQIFLEDFSKCKKNWSCDIKHIAEEINQTDLFLRLVKFDLTAVNLGLFYTSILKMILPLNHMCTKLKINGIDLYLPVSELDVSIWNLKQADGEVFIYLLSYT